MRLQKLTKKQESFYDQVNQGITPVQAASNLYKTKNLNSARVISSRLMNSPKINTRVRDLLDSEGSKATAKHIAKTLEESLYAEKTIVTRTGNIIKVPDYKVRLEASEICLKLRGELSKDAIEDPVQEKTINVTFQLIKARTQEEIQKYSHDLQNERPAILEGC